MVNTQILLTWRMWVTHTHTYIYMVWSRKSSLTFTVFCFVHRQVFDDGQCVHLVQDLLRGEELLDRVLRLPNFTERDASAIMCTLTKTVEYLHSQGVRWMSTPRQANITGSRMSVFGWGSSNCLSSFPGRTSRLEAEQHSLLWWQWTPRIHQDMWFCCCQTAQSWERLIDDPVLHRDLHGSRGKPHQQAQRV